MLIFIFISVLVIILSFPENYLLKVLEVFQQDCQWFHLPEPGKLPHQRRTPCGQFKSRLFLFLAPKGESLVTVKKICWLSVFFIFIFCPTHLYFLPYQFCVLVCFWPINYFPLLAGEVENFVLWSDHLVKLFSITGNTGW